MRRRFPLIRSAIPPVVLLVLLLALGMPLSPRTTYAATLPTGFQELIVFSGLTGPTAIRFAPDGRIFIAEKRGLIKVFDGLGDPTPDIFADLQANVFNYLDRGLLGLAIDPQFPTRPYVYVLYAYDARIGGAAPAWNDTCPDPPGTATNGCVVAGRLSRLQAQGNAMVGSEQVLIEDWCQQYHSHSIGDLAFGPDGALYAGAGDGASANVVDYGQLGNIGIVNGKDYSPYPRNPCGDPPTAAGTAPTVPAARGGALRSQSLRRPAGEPVSLDGTIVRVDPDTGAALPDNPLSGHADPNARRVIAYGLRNPFRFTVRPDTDELWIGDVGWVTWEEINRVRDLGDRVVENFSWPCYEGTARQSGYDSADLTLCELLYGQVGAPAAPHFAYRHSEKVVAGEPCRPEPAGARANSSISGLAFYQNGNYPPAYRGALFFADYARECIWVMPAGADGVPDPAARATFVTGAQSPVDLQIGPDGDLFYVNIVGGNIHRIRYNSPLAAVIATPRSGPAPLAVTFDGTGSSAPAGGLTYAWDLDGDGQFDDATEARPSAIYPLGTYSIRLKVTDGQGVSDISDSLQIFSSNSLPTPTIETPVASTTWKVGDTISFSGSAVDDQDRPIDPSALSWRVLLHHCATPTSCHQHELQQFSGTAGGSFSAPDHDYPAYLELQLTARDSGGLEHTASLMLQPQTTTYTYTTAPVGLLLSYRGADHLVPISSEEIVNASPQLIAPAVQQHLGFSSWSDGGERIHTITVGSAPRTLTATYANSPPTAVAAWAASPGVFSFTFDGALSFDPEGDPLTYHWDFGDGATADGAGPTHSYALPGVYRVRLTVADALGLTGGDEITVEAHNTPPSPTISAPVGGTYAVGDVISVGGGATDPEDGALAGSSLVWQIIRYHGELTETLRIFSGAGGTFTIPDNDDSRIEIRLTAVDSHGGSAATGVTIVPRRVELTIASRPSGMTVHYDGVEQHTPFTAHPIAGSTHVVAAQNSQAGWHFERWLDDPARERQITAAAHNMTLTAQFQAVTHLPIVLR